MVITRSNVLADEIRKLLEARRGVRRLSVPDIRNWNTSKLFRYQVGSCGGVALEPLKSRCKIWVPERDMPLGGMHSFDPAPEVKALSADGSGRHSNLKQIPAFRDGNALVFKPKTLRDAVEIFDVVVP